ncbi:MAG: tetratricopeptide repeat protein [Bacteroidetes bacterium]|nr:tetratricopeptide repeat protein [Bacteroidota bacterium]
MFKKGFFGWFIALFLVCCISAQGKSDSSYIESLLSRSTELQRVNLDSCYLLAEEALGLSELHEYTVGIRGACIRLGSVWMTRGVNEKALKYLLRALALDNAAGDYNRTANDLILLSYAYSALGQQDSGFSVLYDALRISEELNDTSLQIVVFTTLGDYNDSYNRFSAAAEHFLKAAELAKNFGDEERLIFIYMGLGNLHYKQNQFQKALVYYQSSDSLSRIAGDDISRLQNMNNLALVFEELDEFEKAQSYYKEALEGYISYSMKSEEANIHYNFGTLLSKLGHYDSSLYHLNMSLDQYQEIHNLPGVARVLEALAEVYAVTENYTKAFQIQKRYTNLSDSLINAEKIASISEMRTRYETEKKEQEIGFLQGQNDTRQRQRNFFIGGSILFFLFALILLIQRNRIQKERNKSDHLLLNILPKEVANELKSSGVSKARSYENVTVLFTDFVNFTSTSEKLSPTELVAEIDKNFIVFDEIIDKHGLEKIKTIGDAYMAVCGLPNTDLEHAIKTIRAAQEIAEYSKNSGSFQVRIGINSGDVVAGIVGKKKYAYDIWGDTVNTAARMEQNSEPGKINISASTYEEVKTVFSCTYRGKIEAKNKGEIDMYFVQF